MVTDCYPTLIDLHLEPVGGRPKTVIAINHKILYDACLDHAQTFHYDIDCAVGINLLSISMVDKSPKDPDQAIRIRSLALGGIVDQRLIWQGQYRPCYPEPWASQQRRAGNNLSDVLGNTDYLGWNGIWQLEFTVPVYAWLHQSMNLGWLYD